MSDKSLTFIYFMRPIGQLGPVKVGCSIQPLSRLAQYQAWSPIPLEVFFSFPGGPKIEAALHAHLADTFSHHEWFHASEKLQRIVAGLRDGRAWGDLITLGQKSPMRSASARRIVTQSTRQRQSYLMRLHHAANRVKLWVPQDVYSICSRWSGYGREPSIHPTPQEIVRLNEVLANPERHFVSREVRFPALVSVAREALPPPPTPAAPVHEPAGEAAA